MLAAQRNVRSTPLLPVVACEIAAIALLAAGRAGGLHGTMLLVTPLSVAILGCFIAVDRWTDRYKLRSSADAWIARGYDSARTRYAWRIAELTSRGERRALAASIRSLVDEPDHAALRPSRPLLDALAERLGETARPVSATGVLAVRRLLADGATSPLYQPSGDAAPRLAEILDLLEVRR